MKSLVLLLFLTFLLSLVQSKKTKSSEVIRITDIKDWKKELRTKKNVLALFTKDSSKQSSLLTLLDGVSINMRGLATVIIVDCGESTKLCKKLKVSPKPNLLHHFNSGEFNKVYDRKEREESMIAFLKDPTGDVPWQEEEDSLDVKHLDYQGFKRLLSKERLPILVMFYAPWCGHCKRMKPEFNEAATVMKGKAVLVGINADGTGGTGPSKELNVTSFPTILYFEGGEYKFKFGGERTKDGITTWLANPTTDVEKPEETDMSWEDEDDSPVAHLTTETFKPFIKEHSSVLVMFYAPWCGHCKAMKPEYSQSAVALQEQGIEGRLAAVDVTQNRPLGDEFGVKGFPTVIYFKDGNKTFEHPSLRKESDIVAFMVDPKEPPPPAPEEASWSEQEGAVVHLTDDDFEPTIKRKKHVMVMFYAPWCGHCKKAKPEFNRAAEQLSSNNKVMLSAVDCTIHKAICGKHDVKGFPTLLYFSYGSRPHQYSGSRDEVGFIQAMSAEDPTSSPSLTSLEFTAEIEDSVWGEDVVAHLTDGDYDIFIERNSPVFLLYYRNNCITCKTTQDQFTAAAKLLENTGVEFAAMDCSLSERCAKRSQTPYIVLHRGKDSETAYIHSMTTRDMYNYLVSLSKDEL